MQLTEHFRRMAENNPWANDRIYRAVLALEPGEFEAPRTSFFPSLRETLDHILRVDLSYLDMLEELGEGLAIFARVQGFHDPRVMAREQAVADRRLLSFCERQSPGELDRRVPTDRGEAGFVPERIADLLAHLFQHDIHHRGQVHAMLAGTSVKPPQLDEYFLDFDLELRRDDLLRLGLGGQATATS